MKAPTKASTKARAFRTIDNAHRELRIAKQAQAKEAIGPIRPGQDVFILTFGQFSLIDVLVHVLDEIGPASVDISTWTAAHADVQRAADLMTAAGRARRARGLGRPRHEGLGHPPPCDRCRSRGAEDGRGPPEGLGEVALASSHR